jgi:hypothetical protein
VTQTGREGALTPSTALTQSADVSGKSGYIQLYSILRNAQPRTGTSATTKPVFCIHNEGAQMVRIAMAGIAATVLYKMQMATGALWWLPSVWPTMANLHRRLLSTANGPHLL